MKESKVYKHERVWCNRLGLLVGAHTLDSVIQKTSCKLAVNGACTQGSDHDDVIKRTEFPECTVLYKSTKPKPVILE